MTASKESQAAWQISYGQIGQEETRIIAALIQPCSEYDPFQLFLLHTSCLLSYVWIVECPIVT